MEFDTRITEDQIFDLYGDYLLNHGHRPKNIYKFAKDNGMEEHDFYAFFSSFEQIEKMILANLFLKSVELASGVAHSDELHSKERLLNVYFIFFENLTMNRSLVLMILGNDRIQSSRVMNQLKNIHRDFVRTLDFNDWEMMEKANEDVKKIRDKTREEALWLHLVSAIKFWKKDTSPSFEKTDIYIEKTVDTGYELIENEPLKKVLDLGKFLFKETFRKS